MNTKVYIKDENGNIYSENRKTRFRMITVENFDEYKKSKSCIGKSFFRMYDFQGNDIAIEGEASIIDEYIQEKQHSKYLRSIQDKLDIIVISGDTLIDEVDFSTVFDAISDDSFSYDAIDTILSLKMGLNKLSDYERELITKLFSDKHCYTQTEIARENNITQQKVSYQKHLILRKLRKLLKV